MDFDALRAAVVPGAGVVARWPGVVCVAECADRQVMRQLLDVCAAAAGAEPGRLLARRLAMWLGGADAPGDGLRFGTVAVTGGDARSGGQRGEQWAVFLYGSVGLVVPDRQVALSGAQSVAWTDRLLPRPDAPVVLALEGGPIPPGLVDGVHDLRVGVVPGAGAVLVPSGDHGSGDLADEPVRTRQAEPRWSEAGGGDRSWSPEPAPAATEDGFYSGDGAGNGLPSRGGLGAIDSYHPGDAGAERPSGRAHLRPVPSGSNGVAHRGWASRRGAVSDLSRTADRDHDHDRDRDHDQAAAPVDDSPVDTPDRPEERREPELPTRGIGDEHVHDEGRNGARTNGARTNGARTNGARTNGSHSNGDRTNGDRSNGERSNGERTNGARTNGAVNGASYDLLGGPEAPAQDPERSPWSDERDRDSGRPDRIEGWFATGTDGGTEAGMGAVGPSDRRRRRHRLPDDDVVAVNGATNGSTNGAVNGALDGEAEVAPADLGEGADERGADDFAPIDLGSDAAAFGSNGTPAVEETRIVAGPVVEPATPPVGEDDGSGDGTPRLGVPAQDVAPEAEQVHPLADAGAAGEDPPHTTALRSERILGAAPDEPERQALDDGVDTSGLVVEGRPEEAPQRPPVGLLVFDDGATYTVDAEYLMGRMPEADPRVASGALRSLALEDTSGAVSRVHAQIVVNGWEALLVDVGSRNGTFVSPPGEQGWTQLPAGETHLLVPGTRVRIGGRSFQFEAPSGAR